MHRTRTKETIKAGIAAAVGQEGPGERARAEEWPGWRALSSLVSSSPHQGQGRGALCLGSRHRQVATPGKAWQGGHLQRQLGGVGAAPSRLAGAAGLVPVEGV